MKVPPVDYSCLITLGLDPTASVSDDGATLLVSPTPPKIVLAVWTAARATTLPDFETQRAAYIKALRDIMLGETDYTQATDSPLPQVQREAWAAWREAVRAAPDADTGSGPVAWPTPPVVTEAAVPSTVTRWQLRTWLYRTHGVTPANVATLIDGIQDAATKTQAQIDWGDSPIVRRDHPLIDTLGASLGLTSSQIDQGFRDAAALER
jgi:hypothetical protein